METTNLSTIVNNDGTLSEESRCHDPSVILVLPSDYKEAYTTSAVLNALFSLLAILGNSIVLAALPRISSLKPPTKVLIASLAVSDLCVGLIVEPLFLVYIVAGLVGSSDARCYSRVALGLGSDYVIAVSYLTMTILSLDRFLVIRLGMHYRSVVTFRRTVWVIGLSWLFCTVFPVIRVFNQNLSLLFIACGFFICLLISTIANINIYKLLKEHEAQLVRRFQERPDNYINLKRYRKFLRMVLTVYAFHLLCYLPSMGIPLALLVFKRSDLMLVITNFLGTLLLYNSTLNPLLYVWQLRQMHREVMRIAHCRAH